MKNTCDITLLVDRSGSMETIKSDLEPAINKFLDEQKEVEGEALVSIYTFDSNGYEMCLDEQYVGVPIKNVGKFKLEPRSSTPLYEAWGTVINKTGERLRNMSEQDRPSRVIFVVVTDGLENASRNFTQKQVFDMVEHQRIVYKWSFIYLGANQSAMAVGCGLGTVGSSSMSYGTSANAIQNAFKSLSDKVSVARCCSPVAYSICAISGSFFDANDYATQNEELPEDYKNVIQ